MNITDKNIETLSQDEFDKEVLSHTKQRLEELLIDEKEYSDKLRITQYKISKAKEVIKLYEQLNKDTDVKESDTTQAE